MLCHNGVIRGLNSLNSSAGQSSKSFLKSLYEISERSRNKLENAGVDDLEKPVKFKH